MAHGRGRVPALSEGAAMALPWEPGLGGPRALLWDESYFLALQSLPSPSGLLLGQAGRSVVASGRPSPPEALLPPTQLIGTPGTELPGGREAGRQAGFLSAQRHRAWRCHRRAAVPSPLYPLRSSMGAPLPGAPLKYSSNLTKAQVLPLQRWGNQGGRRGAKGTARTCPQGV